MSSSLPDCCAVSPLVGARKPYPSVDSPLRLIESRRTRLRQTIATVSTLPKMDLNHAAGYACFSSLRAVSWEGEETRLTIGRRQADTLRYSSFEMTASIADPEVKFQAARSVQPESRNPRSSLQRSCVFCPWQKIAEVHGTQDTAISPGIYRHSRTLPLYSEPEFCNAGNRRRI
jgi:hypothetical protein